MSDDAPWSRAEILDELVRVERRVAEFFGALSDAQLTHREGEAWTPAEHVRHLNTSVGAVAHGLTVPRWILRLRFGRARAPSRSFLEMRDTYRAGLAAGGAARGRFVPARDDPAAAQVEAIRSEILGGWRRANARLRDALLAWRDRDLDRIRLPHPLLGKLTTREMLFFTLYHNLHHIEAAKRRLGRSEEHGSRARVPS